MAKKFDSLRVNFLGIEFENPFILAAAPPTDDPHMLERALERGWAGAVLKTTSVETEEVSLVYPMMSGLEHEGKRLMGMGNIDLISEHHVDEIVKRTKYLKKKFPGKRIITSIMGSKKEDWQKLVRRLEDAGSDMIECSFSCPQGMLGSKPGFMLGQDPELSEKVAGWVKQAAKKIPVVIKITPQVADISEIAAAIKRSGADGIAASNSIPALMGIDLESWVPYPNVAGKSTYSGYSGPAIFPLTLRTIAEIKKNVDIPITGTGGPSNWKDAIQMMLVGATTIQFCTAVMHYGYQIIDDLIEGTANYLDRKKIKTVDRLVGKALPNIVSHGELSRGFQVRAQIDQDRCVRCGLCHTACWDGGHEAIECGENRHFEVRDEKCVGCSLCPQVCPVHCISLAPYKQQ